MFLENAGASQWNLIHPAVSTVTYCLYTYTTTGFLSWSSGPGDRLNILLKPLTDIMV